VSEFRQRLTINNDLAYLAQVRELVRSGVQRGEFPGHFLNRLQIAVDEAVTNIIEHGYADQPRGKATIDLTVQVSPDTFLIEIVDQGASFDPKTLTDVDIATHAASGRSGGLGVFLMRRIMDRVDYQYKTGQPNRLLLVKNRA
jgi:anti-sigma regulatory factor (Ser/Thr protein kinase)